MSRPGITYLDVAQAATQLTQQQIRPTIEEVRKVLGRGSHSTINRHLREWRERQGVQLEAEQGLPDSLLIAVKGLYAAVQESADTRIEQLTSQHADAMQQLEGELRSTRDLERARTTALAALTAQHEELQALQAHQADALAASQQTVTLKEIALTTLEQRLGDRQAEIDRLLQETSQAQRNLEHYREAVRQHREEERAQHQAASALMNQQLSQLKQQQQASLDQMQLLQQQYFELQQQYQTTVTRNNELSGALQAGALRIQESESLLKQSQAQLGDAQSMLEKLDHQVSQTRRELNDKVLALERAQAQLSYLTANLQQAELTNRELADRNLFLAQEKADLLAQLKLVKL